MGIACMESPDCWWCVVLCVMAGPWICPSDFSHNFKKCLSYLHRLKMPLPCVNSLTGWKKRLVLSFCLTRGHRLFRNYLHVILTVTLVDHEV